MKPRRWTVSSASVSASADATCLRQRTASPRQAVGEQRVGDELHHEVAAPSAQLACLVDLGHGGRSDGTQRLDLQLWRVPGKSARVVEDLDGHAQSIT